MNYLYDSRNGENEKIVEKTKELLVLSNEELISKYNREVKIGIVGVRAQILHIIALHHTFLKKFKKSPIKVVDDCFVSLGKEVVYNPTLQTFLEFETN